MRANHHQQIQEELARPPPPLELNFTHRETVDIVSETVAIVRGQVGLAGPPSCAGGSKTAGEIQGQVGPAAAHPVRRIQKREGDTWLLTVRH